MIPKETVTDSLSDEWKRSPINIPSPGTIASFRNGQYHVHETKTEWRVHLDRYDPSVHPVLHLIDDAPLFLMISETIVTLFSEARGKSDNIQSSLKNQDMFVKNGSLFGFIMILIGFTFIIDPDMVYYGILHIIVPLAVILVGILSFVKNVQWKPLKIPHIKNQVNGIALILIGIILHAFPIIIWSLILISILGIWMFFSAAYLLNRVRKGKSAVPEGFYSRLAIAVISLILFIAIFYAPAAIIELLMIIAGVIIMLIGFILVTTTFSLEERTESHLFNPS